MLPILEVESEILHHLTQSNRLVLTAPTGSGKTTQVPQILLRRGKVSGQILVLQPRRLATRLVAHRVAREIDTPVGETVGYQTRHDSRISEKTRIRFVTEGLFLRLLQSSPRLDGVDVVILDEFHERSLVADAALGLVRRLQETRRPDLGLVIMSATLDARTVASALDCPVIEAHGRAYPVDLRYQPGPRPAPPWDRAADALRDLLAREPEGDVLIFMPGAYEIRRTIEAARERLRSHHQPLSFFPLHGSLPPGQQDAAVSPCPHRKVIAATNVAETSITIEGVRHVIDSGLARVHRHDPRRGIDALLVEAVSQASTEQRTGRAGRTAPGTCTRLWSRTEQKARPAHETPEIRRLDLTEAVLQLKSLGVEDVQRFPWLEPPEARAVRRAQDLLQGLSALDENGHLTPLGRRMALLPMHPRLSRFLVAAAERRCLERAVLWAALIGERDVLVRPLRLQYTQPPEDDHPSDVVVRERAFQRARDLRFDPSACADLGIYANTCREVDRTCRLYRDACQRARLKPGRGGSTEDLVRCLLVAFFDRVALRRGPDTRHCAMAGQKRVELDPRSAARESAALVALDVRELEAGRIGVRTVLSLASAVDPVWLEEIHPGRIRIQTVTAWNDEIQAVEKLETHAYDGLVYFQQPRAGADPAAAEEILVEQILQGNLELEKWDCQVEQWILRVRCVGRWFPERGLIAYDEDDVKVILHEIVSGAARYSQIRARSCLPAVQNALSWQDQRFVEGMAPTHVRLPGGVRMKIEYYPDAPPRGRAKIQDLYDLHDTPRIADGRQQLLLEILGPNFRPVQVTDDLAGFWKNTYPEVRKELRRRYPKHEWR